MSKQPPAIENAMLLERIALVTGKLSEEFPDCRVRSWQDDALEKSQIVFFKVMRESDGAYVTRALTTTSLVLARDVLVVIRVMADGIRKELER